MIFNKNIFAIILIGGMGSRFSKINEPPKQLIKLNKKSLIENQLTYFINSNIKNFIFPLGYKKKYFIDFFKKKKIINKFKLKIHYDKINNLDENKVNILLFDAGKKSSKLKRIKDSIEYFKNKYFLVTYGDGIANINFYKYVKMFEKNKKAIVASKCVNSQYGHFKIKENKIISFKEKPILDDPINIGYYFFTRDIFNNFYKKNFELEDKFMRSLIKNKKIITYNHNGFFFNIDRKKDLDYIKKNYKKLILKF